MIVLAVLFALSLGGCVAALIVLAADVRTDGASDRALIAQQFIESGWDQETLS